MASFFVVGVVGVMWTLARTPAVKGSSHRLVKPDPKNLNNVNKLFSRNKIQYLFASRTKIITEMRGAQLIVFELL